MWPNSSRQSASRSGIIFDSTRSLSYSSRMAARPLTFSLMGEITSLVSTSGRSWNRPV